MIQDYKFYPETETETDKWVNFEFIKHNLNLIAWIDGKEYVLYNITDRLEFRNDALPLLKKDTLGNLKVFYKHDYNNENYVYKSQNYFNQDGYDLKHKDKQNFYHVKMMNFINSTSSIKRDMDKNLFYTEKKDIINNLNL